MTTYFSYFFAVTFCKNTFGLLTEKIQIFLKIISSNSPVFQNKCKFLRSIMLKCYLVKQVLANNHIKIPIVKFMVQRISDFGLVILKTLWIFFYSPRVKLHRFLLQSMLSLNW